MDYFPTALPIPQVGYMCQPSPPQSTAVPPAMYPTLLPPAAAHEIAIRKIPPACALISPNPYPGNAMAIVHLPHNLMQALQREPVKYNRDDMVSTCSSCGQTNTLWDLRLKKMAEELAEDYALKRYLQREIRFEPYPGEEPPHSVANNIAYPTQPTDLCKISNLRANANEFTPSQKNYKNSQMQQTTNNAFSEECDYHQSAGRLGVTESSNESAAQDSAVIDLGNQDANTIDSIPEKYPQNDCIISSHGGSSDSVNNARTDSSSSTRRKKNIRSTTRRDARSNEPEMKMDSNRNYKSSDDMNAPQKKDKTNDTRLIYSSDHQRPSPRNADSKKGVPLNGKPNGLPRSSFPMKSRSYERRGGDYNPTDGFVLPSKSWTKSSNGGVPRKSNRRTSDLSMSMIHEIDGDLFTASPECSLAHCVAEDFRMSAGIAVQFRKLFGHVGDLLNQRKTVGDVAYLEHDGRYIFYLISKKCSYSKPTLENMLRALKTLRRHCEELNVKKLAMPAIGCGLDKLRWEDVKLQLFEEFSQTDIEIFVYHFKEDEGQVSADVSPISNKLPKLKTVEVSYPLTKIDRSTALVVYGTADGKVDKANEPLNELFPYLEEFDKKCKASPKEVFYPIYVRGEYVCVLITRNTLSESFDFARLESSVRKFNSFLKSNKYRYVGIERIEDPCDPLINDKIVNVFRSCLVTTVDLYVCSSPPKIYSSMSPSAPKYSNFSYVNSTSSSN